MWKIKGRYGDTGDTEVIDEFDTEKEAIAMLGEYRLAYGSSWTLWVAL